MSFDAITTQNTKSRKIVWKERPQMRLVHCKNLLKNSLLRRNLRELGKISAVPGNARFQNFQEIDELSWIVWNFCIVQEMHGKGKFTQRIQFPARNIITIHHHLLTMPNNNHFEVEYRENFKMIISSWNSWNMKNFLLVCFKKTVRLNLLLRIASW